MQALTPSELKHKLWVLKGGNCLSKSHDTIHVTWTAIRAKHSFDLLAPPGWPWVSKGLLLQPLHSFKGEKALESLCFINNYQPESYVKRTNLDPELVHQEIHRWENGETPPASSYDTSADKTGTYYEKIYSCYELKASC